ncbi:MAG: hypothetical protein CM1200mP9_06390 [Gammaproteobacteria bacterium]|nr:MAG: hypothetical protein CM1200mP9_06390 [Gammaproteobacteria bacterium]
MEGVEEVLGEKKSVIKRFSLFGAIFGGVSGFLLAAITAVFTPILPGSAHHYLPTVPNHYV